MKVNLAEIWDFNLEFMDWKTTSLANEDNPGMSINSYVVITMDTNKNISTADEAKECLENCNDEYLGKKSDTSTKKIKSKLDSCYDVCYVDDDDEKTPYARSIGREAVDDEMKVSNAGWISSQKPLFCQFRFSISHMKHTAYDYDPVYK